MITKTTEIKKVMCWNCCGSMSKRFCVVCKVKFLGITIKTVIKEL